LLRERGIKSMIFFCNHNYVDRSNHVADNVG